MGLLKFSFSRSSSLKHLIFVFKIDHYFLGRGQQFPEKHSWTAFTADRGAMGKDRASTCFFCSPGPVICCYRKFLHNILPTKKEKLPIDKNFKPQKLPNCSQTPSPPPPPKMFNPRFSPTRNCNVVGSSCNLLLGNVSLLRAWHKINHFFSKVPLSL